MIPRRLLWSRPVPLGWYFYEQWRRPYLNTDGSPKTDREEWAHDLCHSWIELDRTLPRFAYEMPTCPCMHHQAAYDKGRYVPDFECDKHGNAQCYYHQGAAMCYRSGLAE